MEVDDFSSPGLKEDFVMMEHEEVGPRKEGKYPDPVALVELFNKEKNQICCFTAITRLVKLNGIFKHSLKY